MRKGRKGGRTLGRLKIMRKHSHQQNKENLKVGNCLFLFESLYDDICLFTNRGEEWKKNKAQQRHSRQMLTQKVHMIIKVPFYETDSYLFVYYNQIAASGSGNDKDSSDYSFFFNLLKEGSLLQSVERHANKRNMC